MIDTKQGIGYGPFGSTSRTAGPNRFEEELSVHEDPRPTEEEQGLTQTERMDEE